MCVVNDIKIDKEFNPFIRKPEDYKQYMNPLQEGFKQSIKYVKKRYNVNEEKAKEIVKEAYKRYKLVDPVVEYYYTKDNKDKVIKKEPLTKYLNHIRVTGDILAPSYTVYLDPKKEESIHSTYTLKNVIERNNAKKTAREALADKDYNKFGYFNKLQLAKKVLNNSLSGAYASPSTILYNASGHYGLTSITRCVASIGNATTESMVTGNRLFLNSEYILNYITAVITHVDLDKVDRAIRVYKLRKPFPNEVFEALVESGRLYYRNEKDEKEILDYLKKLNGTELAAVLYINDLYNIKNINEEFVRRELESLHEEQIGLVPEDKMVEVLENMPEFILNVVHHICIEDIKGKKINYSQLEDKVLLDKLVSTSLNVYTRLKRLELFIDAFFKTDILPMNINDIKDMARKAIVLSDTDSTCGTYQDWVEWYFGKIKFDPKATALSAIVMMFTTQAIDHNLRCLSTNMNVIPEKRGLLKMKNEFYWSVMVPTNVSKHYYALIKMQEGYAYDSYTPEIKGVALHANNIPKDIKEKLLGLIKEVLETVDGDNLLDLDKILNDILNIEKMIVDRINKGDPTIFGSAKIKPKESYALEPHKSNYFYHMLWEDLFAEKYGHASKPQYAALKINIDLTNNTKKKEYLENSKYSEFAKKLINYFEKYDKKSVTQIQIPFILAANNGVPEELRELVDYNKIILNIMNPFYMILESIGYMKDTNKTLIEMLEN